MYPSLIRCKKKQSNLKEEADFLVNAIAYSLNPCLCLMPRKEGIPYKWNKAARCCSYLHYYTCNLVQ